MPVYDEEKTKTPFDDELRNITGISEAEETAYEQTARDTGDEKSLDADSLQSLEESGDGPQGEASAERTKESSSLHENQIGDGYNDDDKPGRITRIKERVGAVTTVQKAVGGGIIGLIIGIVFSISTITSGPFQFVHIAQLLQRFHFSTVEDNGNSRLMKMYKFGRYASNFKAGTIENTRLGIVGNRVAQALDTKLADIGVTKTYGGTFTAPYTGAQIDVTKLSETEAGKGLKGLSPDDTKLWLEENIGGTVRPNVDGTFTVEPDSGLFGYFANKAINKNLLAAADIDGVAGAFGTRVMGQRDGITWHPIKTLDNNITGAIDQQFTKWLEELKKRISSGDNTELSATAEEKKSQNGEKTTSPDAEAGAKATGEVAKSAEEAVAESDLNTENGVPDAGPSDGVIKQFTESTAGGLALKATAVIGLACAAKGIAKAADDIKHDSVVLPLIRTGMQAMSVGNQVMSGKDMDAQQLGFFAKQLNDPKSGSWAAAKSIQAEEGVEQTGPDLPDSAKISKIQEGNMFTQIFAEIPGLDAVCSVADSAIGGIAMTVVGAITAPVATIGQTFVSKSGLLNGPISSLVRWIAGSPIPTYVVGPTYGNYINYGARMAANDSNAANGGIPLTNSQTTALKAFETKNQQQEIAAQPIMKKLFDPNSPDSVVGKAIDAQPSSIPAGFASIFANIMNPYKIFRGLASILTPRAHAAAEPYDYGFPQIGFSLDVMNSPAYEDPFMNAESVITSLKSGEGKDLIKRANSCFGVTLGTDGSVKSSFTSLDVTKKGFYSNDNNCADGGDTWTRLRLYILDTKTAEGADCYYSGDTESCADVGFGNTSDTTKVTSANVYLLGDSLTDGMRMSGLADSLKAQGWNPTITAACGRHLVGDGSSCAPAPVLSGMNQIAQPADMDAIKNAGVVVVGLGTNDAGSPTYSDDVTAMITKIKALNPAAKIYWTNLISTDGNAPTYQAMDGTLAGLATSNGFTIIDWATQALKVGAYAPGTYHPTDYQPMVDFVVSQLGHAP